MDAVADACATQELIVHAPAGASGATYPSSWASSRTNATAPQPWRRVTESERVGFEVASLTPLLAERLGVRATQGLVVTNVALYSGAAAAGIRPGQILLRLNDQAVNDPDNVARIASKLEPGQVVSLRVRDPEIGETIINYRLAD